ncbi:MAG: right-handed parallel beta-helix repeat-containing protein [Thermoplasmata archaeon]|nr:right-handed parallel beta-helix repeat-containing protein [Thermoplasmata archaeon]
MIVIISFALFYYNKDLNRQGLFISYGGMALIQKGQVVLIVLLFITTCIIPTTAQDIGNSSQSTSRGNWLYVGGSGPGNYSKIQDAIDNASDGDTVFVYSGNYQQGMIGVNKTICLRGEDKNTTVIDGCGQTYIFRLVNVDFYTLFIEINGFTIQNASAGIEIFSHNNTISGNIIQNNVYGIVIGWASNNLIYGNVIRKNSFGISTLGGDTWNNKIERNIIENNSYGITIRDYAEDTFIQNNTIINNSETGISVNGYRNTVVEKNNIFGNNLNAFFIIDFDSLLRRPREITWSKNYWGKTPLRHMIIFGNLKRYPFYQPPPPHPPQYILYNWLNFDWHPAQEPYDIGGS